MTNEHEMLSFAAKAAGIDGKYNAVTEEFYLSEGEVDPSGKGREWWNPLTDDGDALRLAVKLEMSLHAPDKYDHTAVAQYVDLDNDDVKPIHVSEFDPADKNDPYAATRRAIVRAAAAIGEGK